MFKYKGGAMGFLVLQFWLFFRSVFRFLCQKNFGFSVWCSLQFANTPFFNIWFPVFGKNTNGFLGFDIRCGFRFFQLDLFGFRFLFDLSGNYAPPLISNSR